MSKINSKSDSISGTPEYLSPERVRNEIHGFESDWWSFGCFIYELVINPFLNIFNIFLHKEIKINHLNI